MCNIPFLLVLGLTLFSVVDTVSATAVIDEEWVSFVAAIVFVFSYIYLLPSIIAFKYGGQLKWFIFFFNIFLGWTAVCWILCMASIVNNKPKFTVNNYEEL